MSANEDTAARLERMLEKALGAVTDWLELVRIHENDRRARLAEEDRTRRNHLTTVVMAVLLAATLAYFFWLSRR